MDVDKVAASVNAVGAGQIARTGSLNIADALQQQVPGIIISDTTGNPFMPDIQFRGFVASPVAGTPQGLAVYQNGTRINGAARGAANRLETRGYKIGGTATAVDQCREASDRGGEFGARSQCCRGCAPT